ncbi:MAG TPA: glycoside hydrolase family 44 protein [Chthonomonadaceae bacterium]|nr:glycoside hydrolase family 44 protein [Chthonomonadaceae bacterium]
MLVFLAMAWMLGAQAAPAEIHFQIDDSKNRVAISPYIYGTNQPDWKGTAKYLTLTRVGGNRLTAYNWENNASNAGNDYHFQNDGFMGGDDIAGEAMRKPTAEAFAAGASMIMTVPIAGYVSADKKGDGDVRKTPDYLSTRFYRTLPKKDRPFAYPPDTTDNVVYEDEFVHFMEQTFPNAHKAPRRTLFYCLDNEPALWSNTHAEIHPAPLTYSELLQRSKEFASAIKAVAPKALVFGPACYGWNGFQSLQNAPDAHGRNFLDFYLAGMRDAEKSAGKRLLDVLDIHWYPEARGGGKRITESGSDPALIQARLQAPRSLWDPDYKEDSWITQYSTHAPIRLIPRLKEQIEKQYPGTRLAITEYNYGGGGDITGGIAQADALGIFGREGLFAAALWSLSRDERFTYGGFDMFRNYDGQGGAFGDVSVAAQTNDVERSSVYASEDAHGPARMVVVVLNKTDQPLPADLSVRSRAAFHQMDIYQLTAASPTPQTAGHQEIPPGGPIPYTLPPMSVSTLVLH